MKSGITNISLWFQNGIKDIVIRNYLIVAWIGYCIHFSDFCYKAWPFFVITLFSHVTKWESLNYKIRKWRKMKFGLLYLYKNNPSRIFRIPKWNSLKRHFLISKPNRLIILHFKTIWVPFKNRGRENVTGKFFHLQNTQFLAMKKSKNSYLRAKVCNTLFCQIYCTEI